MTDDNVAIPAMRSRNAVDKEHTKLIRDTLARGETFVGELITAAEADWMLEPEEEDNVAFSVRAVEEMLTRSWGFTPDMSPAAPAALAISRAKDPSVQSHNTITIELKKAAASTYSVAPRLRARASCHAG